MKKLVFIVFGEIEDKASGIHAKIINEFLELSKYFSESVLYSAKYCDKEVAVYDYKSRKVVQCKSLNYLDRPIRSLYYISLLKKQLRNDNGAFIYLRHAHNTELNYLSLLRQLKNAGNRLYLEVPTYPYDQEYKTFFSKAGFLLLLDKLFRCYFKKYIERIVTFSDDDIIWGIKTVRISNGVDFSKIRLKVSTSRKRDSFNLIGVASMNYWHGFDRIIEGLGLYLRESAEIDVNFYIVGGGDAKYIDSLKNLVTKWKLEKHVVFCGPQCGSYLDLLFDKADFAIGSLGRHRSGITYLQSLKNREYAARGIPFIYSESDRSFDNMFYVLKAPVDDSPIDICQILNFEKYEPKDIRNTVVNDMSWSSQMRLVYCSL